MVKEIKGFTLIEILTILGTIALMGGLLITLIKPAEIFRCARDSQRIKDLVTLNSVITHYINKNPNLVDLDGPFNFTAVDEASSTIYISVATDSESYPNNITIDGKNWQIKGVSKENLRKINGNGWLPVDLTSFSNLPIYELPVDPINSFSQRMFYSYVFHRKISGFEFNANLECGKFKYGGSEDKVSTDGGDDINILEIGSFLTLLPSEIYGTARISGLKPKIDLGGYTNININTLINSSSSVKISISNIGSTTLVVYNIVDTNKTGRITIDKKYLSILPLSFDTLTVTCNGVGLYTSSTVTTTLEIWNNDIENNPAKIQVTCNIQEHPRISVSPKEINILTRIGSSSSASFIIFNKGFSNLNISNIYFYLEESTSSCKNFVTYTLPSSVIPPSGSSTVTILVNASNLTSKDAFYCKYIIESNDIYRKYTTVKVNVFIISKPGVVPNLRIEKAGSQKLKLIWDEPIDKGGVDVSYYKIYRKINTEPTTSDFIASTSLKTYTDSGLTNGIKYCYKVSAVNIVGEGPLSSTVCAIPSTIPSSPVLSATAGNKQVSLNWEVSDNGGSVINYYNVYWKLNTENNWKSLAANYTATSLVHSKLNICNTYQYYVEAVNENGASLPSNIVSSTPYGTSSPPQNLNASSTQNSIILNWQAPIDGNCASLIRYKIYRSTDGNNFILIASTSPSTLSYTDTNVTSTVTYTYYVTTENSYGESSPSNQVSIRLGLLKCQAPSYLYANPSDRKITLSWQSTINDGYYFVYSSNDNSNYVKIATVTYSTVQYTHTNLINGQTYYYYVTAKGSTCEESNPSPIASSTPGTVPTAPQSFKGEAFKDRIILSWKPPLSDGGSPILQYNLYKNLNKIATLSSSTFSYTDTQITPGTLYFYYISATNRFGEGWQSSTNAGYCLSWMKALGGGNVDWPAYSYITSDNGYLIVGKTLSFLSGQNDKSNGIVIKIDSIGNIEWVRSIGTVQEDSIRSAVELPDGFIIAGEILRSSNNSDIFLAKISSSTGNVIWAKSLGGERNEIYPYLAKDENNNLYLGFTTNSWGRAGSNIVIMKLNSNGDILWAKIFGGDGDDIFYKLKYGPRQLHYLRDKIIAIGYTQSFGAGNYDFLVISLYADNGELYRIRTFGGANRDYLFDFNKDSSWDILYLFGRTSSFGAGQDDFLLLRVSMIEDNISYSVKEAYTYGTVNQDYGFSFGNFPTNLLLLGWTDALGSGNFDMLLIKTSRAPYMNIIWQVITLGGTGDDRLGIFPDSVWLGLDQILISGRTKSVGAGDYDIILDKLDPGLFKPSYEKFKLTSHPTTSIIVKDVRSNIVVKEVDPSYFMNFDSSNLRITDITSSLISNNIRTDIYELNLVSCETGFASTTPSQPINLTVSYSNPNNILNWQVPSSDGGSPILYYIIYRKITDSGNYYLLATTSNTTINDNVGTLNKKYCYKVTAVNSIGESPPSNEACVAPNVPSSPTLMLSSGNKQISLSWTLPSGDPSYYKVYQVINNLYLFIASTTQRTYIHQNLQPGTQYCYAVSGVNSFGEGSYSNIACAIPYSGPTPPQNLSISVGDRVLNLLWQAPVDNGGLPITEYRIYRRELGSSYSNTPYATTGSSQFTYSDTGVVVGRTYCYVITAKNTAAESGYSNEVCKKAGTKPGKWGIRVADYGSNFVKLNWNCLSIPESSYCNGGYPIINYKLYRSTDGINYSHLATITQNNYIDQNVSTGVTYYYKVSVINEIGEGELSDPISVTPQEREIDYDGYILRAEISKIIGDNRVARYTEDIVWKLDLGVPSYVNNLKLIIRNLTNPERIKVYCDNNINNFIWISSLGTTTISINQNCAKIYLTAFEFLPFDIDNSKLYKGLGIIGSAKIEKTEWFQANIKDFDVYARMLNFDITDNSKFLEGRVRAYK